VPVLLPDVSLLLRWRRRDDFDDARSVLAVEELSLGDIDVPVPVPEVLPLDVLSLGVPLPVELL